MLGQNNTLKHSQFQSGSAFLAHVILFEDWPKNKQKTFHRTDKKQQYNIKERDRQTDRQRQTEREFDLELQNIILQGIVV